MTGFGVFSGGGDLPRVGWRTGDHVLDLHAAGLGDVFAMPVLNGFTAQGRGVWESTLERVLAAVEAGAAPRLPLDEVRLHRPFDVADYVDFYASLEHASNLGRMFRPDAEALLPNWRWLPVGYHGRAGTVVVSGTEIVRPSGQSRPLGAETPSFGPTKRLDVELELGVVVGTGSRQGVAVSVESFRDHVFGVVLVNDWSARDIQAWEYQPLGPFLGKSFATSISAWVTPLALLEDSRVQGPVQEPEPPEYLRGGRDWGLDIDLEIELNGAVVSRTNAKGLYWTFPQQLAHTTVNGASLRNGDLLASGTISGSERGSEGSLIELTRNGIEPLQLPDGSERTFLEDGDEVILRGRAGELELGEVRGRVVPTPA
jgi:fumarylacetoacetase